MSSEKVVQPSNLDSGEGDVLPSNSSIKQQHHKKDYIFILRCSVLMFIVVVAGIIGYFAYSVVHVAENKAFEHAYSDLIKQLLPATNLGVLRTADAVLNAVNTVSSAYPNSTDWPYIAYAGFPEMASLTRFFYFTF